MARYIDADKLVAEIREVLNLRQDYKAMMSYFCYEQFIEFLEETPTADVKEVKHGEWFLLDECANEGVYCSVCYKKVYITEYANQKIKSNYCPHCGAKMDGQTPQKLNHDSLCETETYKVGE